MAESFSTTATIVLQPGSFAVPFSFIVSPASTEDANDGSIPYASTISSVAVKTFDSQGTDVTTEMVVSSSNTTTKVTVGLKYPATSGNGEYRLEILATLDTGAVMQFDFTKITASTTTI